MSSENIKEKFSGRFIVLDGPDGCGKSTQLKLLANYLGDKDVEVVQTYDPGGTKISDQISRFLKYDAKGEMDAHTEVMLFMASRAQLVAEVIKPALAIGKTVLCDRFISATCAYQGSSGCPVDKIIEMGKFAVEDIWPDLTLILDISAEEGRNRTGHKRNQRTKTNHKDANQAFLFENVITDRFDSRSLEYHRKVRKGFLKIGEYYPGIVEVIDATGDIETVHKKVIEAIKNKLNQ